MKITKTKYALVVACKCGGIVAATMLYGGVDIDTEFTDTIAKVVGRGGEPKIVNTEEQSVTLKGCSCEGK